MKIVDDGALGEARRRHTLFLVVTGLVFVGVCVASRAVLLPFVLALVIAYVLAPLVAWVEARRVPRALAIILVYVLVLGSLGGFVRLTAPRVVHELANLRRELPSLARTVRVRWVPAIQERIRGAGFGPDLRSSDAVEASPTETAPAPAAPAPAEAAAPSAPSTETAPAPAAASSTEAAAQAAPSAEAAAPPAPTSSDASPTLVARARSDGAFSVELSAPLSVTPAKGGGYVVEPLKETHEPGFDLDRLVADAAGKSLLYAQHNALELVKIGRDIIAGVSRFFFVFGITLMLAAYIILTRERIMGFLVSLTRPSWRPSFHELIGRIDRGLAGVVRGQLMICLVNGVLSAIGFAVVGLKYWPVLALIATVFSLIPIFGSIISSIPAVALGLTQSFGTAVFVLVWIVGIHQLEANVLNPKIMGDAAKIHPVLVIFSLLVGEHFFHTVGALLAVPCMSVTQSIFTHIRARLQARDPEMSHEPVGSLMPPPPDSRR